ncbi:MAG: AsmA family protein [Acidobacteriota bacterium]
MKLLFKLAAGAALLLLVGVALVYFLVDANTFRPELESRLTAALGRKVTLGDLSLSLLQGGVTAHKLSISDDPAFSSAPFLTASTLDIGVDLWPLITTKRLNVRALTVHQPQIVLLQTADGRWNFSTIGSSPAPDAAAGKATAPSSTPDAPSASTPLAITVSLLRITEGEVSLGTVHSKQKPQELKDIDLEVKNFAPTVAFPVTLKASVVGGGEIAIDGTVGPIAQASASDTPFDTKIKVTGLNLVGSGFIEADSGIGGLISFDGGLKSDGTHIDIEGTTKAEKVKLAKGGSPAKPDLTANLKLHHDMSTRRGAILPTSISFGAAKGTFNGTYNLAGERPEITAAFNGKQMPLPNLEAFLPALDIVLPTGATLKGGDLTAELSAHGPVNRLLSTGSITISHATVANYDLGGKLRFVQQLSGIKSEASTQFETVGADFDLSDSGTTIRNLRVIAPSLGDLTGAGTISASHQLDFAMQAKLKTGGMLAAIIGQRSDNTTIPFFIRGTSANPTFSADLKSVTNEKLQQVLKNPEGAIKNAEGAAKTVQGIVDIFRKPRGTSSDQPAPQTK